MPDTASLVSAVAAALAAGLAGANLYVSGRRDRERWAREALVDLFVSYLDASFQLAHAVWPPSESDVLHLDGLDAAEIRLTKVRQARDDQMATLTKLRILTAKVVVERAVALHEAGHRVVDLHFANPPATAAAIEAAHADLWRARLAFVASCKRALGLRGRLALTLHAPRYSA